MLQLTWIKFDTAKWIPLTHDMGQIRKRFGVYVIWHGSTAQHAPWTVRVGQGDIADRLACHQDDEEVQAYAYRGGLWATWASVSPVQVDGVERYLAEQLDPLVGSRWPNVAQIPVNLPWDKAA